MKRRMHGISLRDRVRKEAFRQKILVLDIGLYEHGLDTHIVSPKKPKMEKMCSGLETLSDYRLDGSTTSKIVVGNYVYGELHAEWRGLSIYLQTYTHMIFGSFSSPKYELW